MSSPPNAYCAHLYDDFSVRESFRTSLIRPEAWKVGDELSPRKMMAIAAGKPCP
ncbi:hypothetical protein SMMN14_08340 [Sphaerulina musiva]